MNKETKEAITASIIVLVIFGFVLFAGVKMAYDAGFNRGVEVNHGDKWDCAYSYATGFLMCDRTPKYK